MTTSISEDKLGKAKSKVYDATHGEAKLENLDKADMIMDSLGLESYIKALDKELAKNDGESFTDLQKDIVRAVKGYYDPTFKKLERDHSDSKKSWWAGFFYTAAQGDVFEDRKKKLLMLVNGLKFVDLKIKNKEKRDGYLTDLLILVAKQPFKRAKYWSSNLKDALETIIDRINNDKLAIIWSQEQIHDLEASVNGKDGIGREIAMARKEANEANQTANKTNKQLRIQGQAIRKLNAKLNLKAQMDGMSDDESDDEEDKPNNSKTNKLLLNDYDGNQQNSQTNKKFKRLALEESMNHHQPDSSGNNGSSSKVSKDKDKSKSKR